LLAYEFGREILYSDVDVSIKHERAIAKEMERRVKESRS
jgi:hypothetical protein